MADDPKKVLHAILGSEDWKPTEDEVKQIVKLINESPQHTEVMDFFKNTDDKRVGNNSTIENYDGPDDVSMTYVVLTDEKKKQMGEIKLSAQLLINDIRALGPSAETTLAVRKIQEGAMWAIKWLTSKEN